MNPSPTVFKNLNVELDFARFDVHHPIYN